MDELAGLPTRSLNDFESTALEKLSTEEVVVIEEHEGKTLMLGSVRAAESCLQCHSGPRGRLLGAFSYELVPYQSAPKPETEEVAKLN